MEIDSLMLLLRSEFQDKLSIDMVENENRSSCKVPKEVRAAKMKEARQTPQHKSDMGMRFPFEGLYAKSLSQEIFHSMPPFHLKKKKKNVSPFFSFSKIFMD